MSTICYITFIIALTVAFIILLIGKLGLRNYLIARAPKLISELLECDFCLSFWLSLILACILAIIIGDINIIFIPVLSTPIIRFLL